MKLIDRNHVHNASLFHFFMIPGLASASLSLMSWDSTMDSTQWDDVIDRSKTESDATMATNLATGPEQNVLVRPNLTSAWRGAGVASAAQSQLARSSSALIYLATAERQLLQPAYLNVHARYTTMTIDMHFGQKSKIIVKFWT